VAVPYLDHPRPVAFAHRGGAAHHPENSWPAFEYAVKLGYAYLETDARSTSDGALLSFHDATLDRVTDGAGQVIKMTYKQVAAARIGGKEPIPLMEDLLGTFGDLRFNIDLKDSGTIEPLARVLKRTGAWDRVCVTSFSGRRLLAAQPPGWPAPARSAPRFQGRSRPGRSSSGPTNSACTCTCGR